MKEFAMNFTNEEWSLIKTQLMPNRFSLSEVYNHANEPVVAKVYRHFDTTDVFEHYKWLQRMVTPCFSKVIDTGILADGSVFVKMEKIEGEDLWAQITESNLSEVVSCIEQFQKRLVDQSVSIFGERLPAGMGLIHSDFHLGNIIGRTDQSSELKLVDLDAVKIGHFEDMVKEWILNVISHPKLISQTDLQKSLIERIQLKGMTKYERSIELKKVSDHYYDYYREFDGFFETHKLLLRTLEGQV